VTEGRNRDLVLAPPERSARRASPPQASPGPRQGSEWRKDLLSSQERGGVRIFKNVVDFLSANNITLMDRIKLKDYLKWAPEGSFFINPSGAKELTSVSRRQTDYSVPSGYTGGRYSDPLPFQPSAHSRGRDASHPAPLPRLFVYYPLTRGGPTQSLYFTSRVNVDCKPSAGLICEAPRPEGRGFPGIWMSPRISKYI